MTIWMIGLHLMPFKISLFSGFSYFRTNYRETEKCLDSYASVDICVHNINMLNLSYYCVHNTFIYCSTLYYLR